MADIHTKFFLTLISCPGVRGEKTLRRSGTCATFYGFGGPSPPEDPPNTLRPSGSVTRRAFALLEPSLAREPSTVTWSPVLRESLLQPCFSRTGIAPSSKFQLVTLPSSPFTST